MPERVEDDALVGVIPLTIGQKRVNIPVLTIAETDTWLARNGQIVSDLTVEDDVDPGTMLSNAMRAGTAAAIEALLAYDTTGVLGDADHVRAVATPKEIHDALEVVYEAALPFDSDAARSVAAAYGGPTRLAMTVVTLAMARLSTDQPSVPWTPSASSDGASDTTRSGAAGHPSNSSSAGRTARTSRAKRPPTSATSSPTA